MSTYEEIRDGYPEDMTPDCDKPINVSRVVAIADDLTRIATEEAYTYFEADGSIADEAVPSDFLRQYAAGLRNRARS